MKRESSIGKSVAFVALVRVAPGLLVLSLSSRVVNEIPANAIRAAGMLPVLWAFGPRLERLQKSRVSSVAGVS